MTGQLGARRTSPRLRGVADRASVRSGGEGQVRQCHDGGAVGRVPGALQHQHPPLGDVQGISEASEGRGRLAQPLTLPCDPLGRPGRILAGRVEGGSGPGPGEEERLAALGRQWACAGPAGDAREQAGRTPERPRRPGGQGQLEAAIGHRRLDPEVVALADIAAGPDTHDPLAGRTIAAARISASR